jgi:hypothetical protein
MLTESAKILHTIRRRIAGRGPPPSTGAFGDGSRFDVDGAVLDAALDLPPGMTGSE